MVLKSRGRNLYYRLEAPEPDTRYYYSQDDVSRISLAELKAAGIEVPAEPHNTTPPEDDIEP